MTDPKVWNYVTGGAQYIYYFLVSFSLLPPPSVAYSLSIW